MRLRGIEGMGLGDVKLIGMLGAFLGVTSILPIVLLASILGALVGTLMLAWPRRSATPQEAASTQTPQESTSMPVPAPPTAHTDDAGEDDWVSASLAKAMNGALELGSTNATGATFCLRLSAMPKNVSTGA